MVFEPLSHQSLRAAALLLQDTFPTPPLLEHFYLSLPLSLAPKWLQHFTGLVWLQYWVVTIAGQIVGITGVYCWQSDPTSCWIGWTGVVPTYRKQGIGTALIHWVIDRALSYKSVQTIKVYTGRANTGANRLYSKLGFSLVHSQDKYLFYSLNLQGRSSVEH